MMPVFAPRNDYPGLAFGPQLEEDVQPVDQVMFVGTPEQKDLTMAARIKAAEAGEKPSTSLKVKVVEPYRVLHEGKPYVGGEVLEIPRDEEHDLWVKSGWVKEVK